MSTPCRPGEFRHYTQFGAYHWIGIHPARWWQSDPFNHARYDLPLAIIGRNLNLAGSLGLDIGCGDGVMLHKITARGGIAVGLDLDRLALQFATERCRQLHHTSPLLIDGSCYEMPIADEAVDFVVAIQLMQHLETPADFLREAARVLKPSGVLCLTTPNRAGFLKAPAFEDGFRVYYQAHELRELLTPYFRDIEIIGQNPRALVQLWRGVTRVGVLNGLVKMGFRALSTVGLNPFVLMTAAQPSKASATLVAICRTQPRG
jgi:SAM-dependent methyltransferase